MTPTPKNPSRALVRISVIAALTLVGAGLFLRSVARSVFGVEELLPPPTVHLKPDPLFSLGVVVVTNTLLSAWLATLAVLALFGLAQLPGPVGRGLREVAGLTLDALWRFVTTIAGQRWSPLTFSFVGAILLFVVANAWLAILPVYGPVLFLSSQTGHPVPLLRGAGTDINLPLSLAILSGVYVESYAMRSKGLKYFKELLPLHRLFQRPLMAALGELYLAVLEGLMRFARLLSFTFRLFGATLAGELLLLTMSFLTPLLLVIPFYGLELLLGLLQGLVFSGLTLAFLTLADSPPSLEDL